MALPSSGTITLAQIQTEFGGTNPIDLSEYYRGGAYVTANNTGVPTSGAISLTNFYGAVKQFSFTNSSSLATPQNLRTLATAAGWNGTDYLVFTNSGVISSNTTASPALTVDGSFPNGVKLINTGTIVGMGGRGGNYGAAGSAGGNALLVSSAVTIANASGTLAGGGGGGSSSTIFGWCGTDLTTCGGGGASGLTQSSSGSGGNWGGYNSSLSGSFYSVPGGGYQVGACGVSGYISGAGGTWGTAGGSTGYAGGAAGNAVSGNAFVTWDSTGTRYGPLV